uniref:Response regulator receiver domain-containing protein n=1 Tax=Candidatus Kentrum sp. DK TaxID=2126562 RepID=A0A450SBP5_9GAMM|nr:MAG: Response regulator receiver domain-containing protein [Candidatus Kentron sp. DK]
MKYLFVDDMPNYVSIHRKALGKAGHVVVSARDLDFAWDLIEKESLTGSPFDMVLIDLGMDRKDPAFEQEDRELRGILQSRGYGDLPISGQSLGLRLWRKRKTLWQRYCYITNHSILWVDNADGQDPEFGGKLWETVDNILLLDKSDLWLGNIEKKLQVVGKIWENEGWLN